MNWSYSFDRHTFGSRKSVSNLLLNVESLNSKDLQMRRRFAKIGIHKDYSDDKIKSCEFHSVKQGILPKKKSMFNKKTNKIQSKSSLFEVHAAT